MQLVCHGVVRLLLEVCRKMLQWCSCAGQILPKGVQSTFAAAASADRDTSSASPPAMHLHVAVLGGCLACCWPAMCYAALCLPCVQLGGQHHMHHFLGSSGARLAEWPPAGSMGRSPGMMLGSIFGSTPPMGRSVDMVDMCTQLMEAGGERVISVTWGEAGALS